MSRIHKSLLLAAGMVIAGAGQFAARAADPSSARAAGQAADKQADYNARIAPLLKRFCFECHGPKKQEAEIGFQELADASRFPDQRATWERVLEMVEFAAMPPEDEPQPTEAERETLVAWIRSQLTTGGAAIAGDPGRVTIRRLNRAEYNNTVRDLLGVEIKPADDFPSDDVGYGFDNIGEVLSLPPLLMEKYLNAAEQIAEAAIVIEDPSKAPGQRRDRRRLDSKGSAKLERSGVFTLNSEGEVSHRFEFQRAGDYILRLEAGAQQAGDEPARMELRLDDKPVTVFDVRSKRAALRPFDFRLHVEQGEHKVSAAFINDFYDPQAKDENARDRNLYVGAIELIGPVDIRPEDLPESHRRLITIRPDGGRAPLDAARQVLRPFISRAFRRLVKADEVERFANLVQMVVDQQQPYERGIQVAVAAVLVSPHFLFRVERDAQPDNPQARRKLNDFELASRLSYFLWSSMPDEELFALARQRKLRDDVVLRRQVARMLQDRKAAALVENFAGQWLNLRMLDEIAPDPDTFPDFDHRLREDMRRETLLFFDAIVREDRSILELLDGRFSYINSRLADHYGVVGIETDEFRRVDWKPADPRAGVLTQASILTLTSNPKRTSPVKRGKWIMENILGTPPPEPPPDVPVLEETQKAAPNMSLREQLELHRKDAGCASCHRQMDALGFGFENFDPVGRWRDRDGRLPIDASGVLPTGEKFNGP
ncbi:MAG: DUF1592 domain-containing protein, partial [Planctomycetes bacterium]|nr:DUF1592 domain-containing protein [Planctomycetota bacterium]